MFIAQHRVQDQLTAIRVVLRMADRIVFAGILGNGRYSRRLGYGQIADILIKIPIGGSLNSQRILAQVNRIQISLQDLLLRHDLFQLDSQILFLELTLYLFDENVSSLIKSKTLFFRSCWVMVLAP